jgi:hypothetical protein
MNIGCGGAQRHMLDKQIESKDRKLGHFDRVLGVSNVQSMNFIAGNIGPFWMIPAERDVT